MPAKTNPVTPTSRTLLAGWPVPADHWRSVGDWRTDAPRSQPRPRPGQDALSPAAPVHDPDHDRTSRRRWSDSRPSTPPGPQPDGADLNRTDLNLTHLNGSDLNGSDLNRTDLNGKGDRPANGNENRPLSHSGDGSVPRRWSVTFPVHGTAPARPGRLSVRRGGGRPRNGPARRRAPPRG
ncbi:pentapeptide repeat-containing protein [Propionicimonas sp.]|uniref:pentapeptide repeat-containing protein n=1 Tax=Propionicimonas sp. TaxID=1955623 RepID=UPI0039E51DC8